MILINKREKKAIKCCKAEAARILGVSYMTIYRWEKERYKEKRGHECYFDVENIKIKRKNFDKSNKDVIFASNKHNKNQIS